MKKFILLFTFLLLPKVVFADNEFLLSCDKNKINVNDQVICRLSFKSDDEYNYIKYDIAELDGLSLVDVRSNYSNLWNVKNNESVSQNIVNGLQEFGILLFKASKSGEYNLKVTNISYGIYDSSELKDVKEVSTKVKVISDDNFLKSIKINDVEIKDFDINKFNYTYETDLSEINIEAISNNNFANVSGAGKITLTKHLERVVVPIIVTSESGASRAYILNIVNKNYVDNNMDKTLDDLIIKNDAGDTIIFDFKSDIYDYNIEVGNKVNYVNISPKILNKDSSFVKGFNGGKINIKSGNNIVLIKIVDKENNEKTYVLNIIKPIESFSNNSYLKSIDIKGYNLKFSKKVRNYNLEIKRNDRSLDSSPVLDDENASYEISGNENLKNGSAIYITVTAPDTSNTVYTINISVKKVNMFMIFYLIIPVGLIYLGYKNKNSIVKLLKKKKLIEELTLDELLTRYNLNYKDKGLTKFFDKLSEEDKRTILIESLKNNILANKTSLYLNLYKANKNNVKKNKKSNSKNKSKKKNKKK